MSSKRVGHFTEVLIGGSSAVESGSAAACFGFSGGNNSAQGNSSGTRVLSSSVGASGNETDEYDSGSEEGGEAVVDEAPSSKLGPLSRSSSKRCRAAEVHNLSEKTDKASMLDEAIEYLN